jgi:hypothetical protein
MDGDQMPPLEPTAHSQPSNSNSTSNSAAAEAADDAHMQPAQSRTHNDDAEDDDSMPDLQSVSSSSDEEDSDDDDESDRDANEVQMQAVQDDDNDSAWTDEDEDMPSLERINGDSAPTGQTRANRRPRVEDDQDDERDRRHPSQRVADTMSVNEPPPSTAPSTGTATPVPAVMHFPPPQPLFNPTQNGPAPTRQPTPRPLPPIPPHMLFRIPLARFRATTQNAPGNNNGAAGNNNANDNANANFTGQPMIGGFAITIDNNGMPVLHAHPPHQHAHPGGNGNGDPNASPGQPQGPGGGVDGVFPQDLSALFNLFGNAIGIGFGEREQEDPERAKRLVDALEEVPVGLVRRLGRVGGGVLAGEEGAGASGGDGGCAICWDSLLDGDLKGEGWTSTEKKDDIVEGEDAALAAPEAGAGINSFIGPSASADTVVGSSSSDSLLKETEPSTKNESKSDSETEQPKIVSLPCAHVFHAACLIPWFSRPRQTTCPTCRFNIDPENLTYVRRRAPAPPNGGNVDTNGNTGATQAQAQGGEQPQPQDAAQPPLPFNLAGLRLPTPAGFNLGAGVGTNPPNANAGDGPDPNIPPRFLAFSPEHIEQASRDILAGTRAELAASIASAQAARDNVLAPSDPAINTLDDPRLGNVAAAAASLERAEASLARVEQWLNRVGMAGGLLTRLGAGALQAQGLGQRPGNQPADANGNADATPIADVNATAPDGNGEGEIIYLAVG